MNSMISKEEVRALADLARLSVSDSEVENLQRDISNVLEYVGQVSAISSEVKSEETSMHHNVLREDTVYGASTGLMNKREELLAALPQREGNYALVRKILHKDE